MDYLTPSLPVYVCIVPRNTTRALIFVPLGNCITC